MSAKPRIEFSFSRSTVMKMAAAFLLLTAALAGPASAAQRVALVIGNAAYKHAPRLANPLNDAGDIGAALGRLGFKVSRLENADQAALQRGLKAFALAATTAEMAVVFYAGHGIEVGGRNFLVPVDAQLKSDRTVEFETVPLELVSRAVEGVSGLGLVILDACRDNPFAAAMKRSGATRSGATRSIGRGLARVEPSGEMLVAYAAKGGTVASDGQGRNSPYTRALLAHLEEPGLEVGLLFRKVRDAVIADTGRKQEPFVYGSLSSKGAYLAGRPPAGGDPGIVIKNKDRLLWEAVRDSKDPAELQLYLDRFYDGTFAAVARIRLKRLLEQKYPIVEGRKESECPAYLARLEKSETLRCFLDGADILISHSGNVPIRYELHRAVERDELDPEMYKFSFFSRPNYLTLYNALDNSHFKTISASLGGGSYVKAPELVRIDNRTELLLIRTRNSGGGPYGATVRLLGSGSRGWIPIEWENYSHLVSLVPEHMYMIDPLEIDYKTMQGVAYVRDIDKCDACDGGRIRFSLKLTRLPKPTLVVSKAVYTPPAE